MLLGRSESHDFDRCVTIFGGSYEIDFFIYFGGVHGIFGKLREVLG